MCKYNLTPPFNESDKIVVVGKRKFNANANADGKTKTNFIGKINRNH